MVQNLIFSASATCNFQKNTAYQTWRLDSIFTSIAVQAMILEQKEKGIYTCYGINSDQVELQDCEHVHLIC